MNPSTSQAVRQEIYDIAATHLLRQNAKSTVQKGCAYRGEGDRRCAIGALIADEVYRDSMEGLNVGRPRILEAIRSSGFDLVCPVDLQSEHLLRDLQRIHDNHDPEAWRGRLISTARDYGLSTAAIQAPEVVPA